MRAVPNGSSALLGPSFAAAILFGCSTDPGTQATDHVQATGNFGALDSVCVETINSHRATISLAPLSRWTDSAACFARQADLDFATGTGHANFGLCKEAAQNTCPGWNTDTAFSARASTLKQCLQGMWNEGPGTPYSAHGHYINMASTGYAKVGCGFHHENGSLWINMDFR